MAKESSRVDVLSAEEFILRNPAIAHQAGDLSLRAADIADGQFVKRQGSSLVSAVAGGGVPDEFKIGAFFETFGASLTSFLDFVVPLDSGNAQQNYLHGLTLNGTNDGLVVATKGRYLLLTSNVWVAQHATLWVAARSGAIGGAGLLSQAFIPPITTFDFSSHALYLPPSVEVAELDVGAVIQWHVQAGGANVALSDGYFQVQYLGPTTAI